MFSKCTKIFPKIFLNFYKIFVKKLLKNSTKIFAKIIQNFYKNPSKFL